MNFYFSIKYLGLLFFQGSKKFTKSFIIAFRGTEMENHICIHCDGDLPNFEIEVTAIKSELAKFLKQDHMEQHYINCPVCGKKNII